MVVNIYRETTQQLGFLNDKINKLEEKILKLKTKVQLIQRNEKRNRKINHKQREIIGMVLRRFEENEAKIRDLFFQFEIRINELTSEKLQFWSTSIRNLNETKKKQDRFQKTLANNFRIECNDKMAVYFFELKDFVKEFQDKFLPEGFLKNKALSNLQNSLLLLNHLHFLRDQFREMEKHLGLTAESYGPFVRNVITLFKFNEDHIAEFEKPEAEAERVIVSKKERKEYKHFLNMQEEFEGKFQVQLTLD